MFSCSSDAATASLEQVEQPRLGELDHREQQIEVEVAADDRGGAQRRARVGAEALHTPPDHLAHALGQAQLGQVSHEPPAPAVLLHDRAGLRQVTQELTGEERVAGRLARDLPRERTPVLVQLVPGRASISATTSSASRPVSFMRSTPCSR